MPVRNIRKEMRRLEIEVLGDLHHWRDRILIAVRPASRLPMNGQIEANEPFVILTTAKRRSAPPPIERTGASVAIALHGDSPEVRQFRCEPAPDPGGQILHRCRPKIVDLVQKA